MSTISPRSRSFASRLALATFPVTGLVTVLGLVACSVDEANLEPLSPTDRVRADIEWLADDAREGRGIGTDGLVAAEEWLAERFEEIGLEPAGDDGYFHAVDVPVSARRLDGTRLVIDGVEVPAESYVPANFSSSVAASGRVVPAGYGIVAPELGHDDYADLDVEGAVVVARRFVPPGARFDDQAAARRHGDLRQKAFLARERGAAALLLVDWPSVAAGEEMPSEAVLPSLAIEIEGDAGLPVAILDRASGSRLFADGDHRAELTVELEVETAIGRNVVGRIAAPSSSESAESPSDEAAATLVGAHFDHLGFGDHGGSLDPDAREPHNGADDNASGTAALLEVARRLQERRSELGSDVWLVGFVAEESGLVGSTHIVRRPPAGLDAEGLRAMLNFDMVGRLENDRVAVLGAGSAAEWPDRVERACATQALVCEAGGDGYGPSDQTPFYAAGVPVLHWFTGTHEDYHRPSDDADKVNVDGVVRIAAAATDVVVELSNTTQPLTYVETEAPAPSGDMRSFGASLGTVPDYVGDDRAGVLLSGTRPGSAAARAGVLGGDLLVGLDGREIRDIHDFVFVLRSLEPGVATTLTVVRGEERLELDVTPDESKR